MTRSTKHPAWELYRERGADALWTRALPYMSMSLDEAMVIQHRLLEEQLRRLSASRVGRAIFDGARPTNADELRSDVRMTTYDDYRLTLGERLEDALPERAQAWIRTSGRSHDEPKWVPSSYSQFEECRWIWTGALLMSMADECGQVRLREQVGVLNMTAPPPYGSGTFVGLMDTMWPLRMMPRNAPDVDALPFDARMSMAFSEATREGVDAVTSQASVLAGIGESFAERRPPGSVASRVRQPRAFTRMAAAALRAKLAGRGMLPRDAWPDIAGIIVGGMDCSLFRSRIHDYWGRYPLEVLVSSEGNLMAIQGPDRTAMTPVPSLNFFEFILEDDIRGHGTDGRQLRTVLLDELEPDRKYEIVLTNLLGGALVRYRTGDIIRVTARRNDATGVRLPQIVHYARRTDLLEIGGFVTLNEQVVWRAIEDAAIPYEDWTVRKEIEGTDPILHLRLEPRPGAAISEEAARDRIHRALRLIDPDWADMEEIAGLTPLRVTFLPSGTFQRYRDRKVAAGADLGQLKPQHMNPADSAIGTLLEIADAGRLDRAGPHV